MNTRNKELSSLCFCIALGIYIGATLGFFATGMTDYLKYFIMSLIAFIFYCGGYYFRRRANI